MTCIGKRVRSSAALICGLLCWADVQAVVSDIDNEELSKLIKSGVPVIDIRTAPEWLQTGVVPGSHLLTFFDEQGKVNAPAWVEKARHIAKPGDPVIVICRTGNRTKAVSQFLSDRVGYAKVYNVRNGIVSWAKDGRPVAAVAQSAVTCQATNTC